MYRVFIFIFFSLLLIAGCNNSEDVTIKYIDNDPLYFDYKIWGEEGRDYVTVMLQYRFEDQDGSTRVLKDPSKVEFDGSLLQVDSSKMSGYFYEFEKPLDSFAGNHLITFTDSAGKVYRESFEFIPFSLKTELPEIVHRKELAIQLEGLQKEDYIRIIALDTVFKSRGINEVDTVKNGLVIITKDWLKNLVNGTIHLELYKEEEWRVKNATTAGGFLSISYGLKREFELAD
ncbi:MAG: hypothetical protein JWM28_4184 [Chitinophagaceae bacterium]|nr:hypothetical protein [Chitinophagaceae bacterium]